MRAKYIFTLIAGMFVILMLGGCSIPRAIHLHNIVHNEMLVPPDDQRVNQSVDSFIFSPRAEATVITSMNPQDATDWYRQALEERGWVYKKSYTYDSYSTGKHGYSYYFERSVAWVMLFGSLAPEHQEMKIIIVSAEDGGCEVKFEVSCKNHYIWDVPTKTAMYPFLIMSHASQFRYCYIGAIPFMLF